MVRNSHRCVLVATVVGAAACQSPPYIIDRSCAYTDVEDPVEMGFSAADVIEAASVSTTGLATSEDIADTWFVSLEHAFAADGEPWVIDFGFPDDPEWCPAGRALAVPLSYEITGTIGPYAVHDTRVDVTMVATAAELDVVSFLPSDNPSWCAEVDPDLQAIALSAVVPESLRDDCELTFSLVPMPDNGYPGAWADELATGALAVGCHGTYTGSFLRWTSVIRE